MRIGTVDLSDLDIAILDHLRIRSRSRYAGTDDLDGMSSAAIAEAVAQAPAVVRTRLGVLKRVELVEQRPDRRWQLTESARRDVPWRPRAEA